MISYSEHKYRVSVEGNTIDIKEVKKSLGLPLDDSKLYVWLPAIPSAGDLIDFGTEYRVDDVSLSPILEMPDSTVYSGDDTWVARFANGKCIGSKVHATVYL